jgi:hypothetical protein
MRLFTTRPPAIKRKRGSLSRSPSSSHGGSQFTPLMCPVKRVTITRSPFAAARSSTWRRRSSMRGSTLSGVGMKSSQSRKMRTPSRLRAAISAMSDRTSSRSNSFHQNIALVRGQ